MVFLVTKVRLRVAEAQRRDVGRFIVRVDNNDMEKLKIRVGDIIEIYGGKVTAAIAWPAYSQDQGRSIIRMEGSIRRNAKITLGDSVDIKVILPEGNVPISYYMFGPTPDNPVNHLYEFLYDPVTKTGASFNDNNEIILHFVDGERGDFDLMANSEILDPGAPALFAASVATSGGGGGGGGCTLGNGESRPAQAGAWYILLLLSMLYGIWRSSLGISSGSGVPK